MRILVVEDDPSIASSLRDGLRQVGFEVDVAPTGAEALARAPDADLVLLDLGLPDLDGQEVCRRLRADPATRDLPVIVLTARRDEVDRVLGLELGADDYVVKPFSFRELVARIRAVHRRTGGAPAGGTENEVDTESARYAAAARAAQSIGSLTIDRRTRRVTLDGEDITLTTKEFDVLAFLAEDPGAVRSRQDILETVWDTNWYGPTKTLDAHVAAVRRKLGDPRWVEAVRSVGFRLGQPA